MIAVRSASPHLRALADALPGAYGGALLQALESQGLWASALLYEGWDSGIGFVECVLSLGAQMAGHDWTASGRHAPWLRVAITVWLVPWLHCRLGRPPRRLRVEQLRLLVLLRAWFRQKWKCQLL